MVESEIRLIIVDSSAVASSENAKVSNYRLLSVPKSLTPDDIIQLQLGLPLETRERVPIQGLGFDSSVGKMCTLMTSIKLKCPSLGTQLDADIPLYKQGIVADTVFVLDNYVWVEYDRLEDDPCPRHHAACKCEPIRNVRDFNQLVETHPNKSIYHHGRWKGNPLLAVLLYTDEDAEIAKYVRLNFSALDKMSGDIIVFVVERPPESSLSESIDYWKERLTFETYVFWGMKGWSRTKPYDKAATYDIAMQLGVFAYQMPCVAFFEYWADKDVVVVPITGELSAFFRNLFGSLSKVTPSSDHDSLDNWVSGSKKRLKEIVDTVISSGRQETSDKNNIATYIFNDQTVFINRSSGRVNIEDFQKRGVE